MSSTAIGEKKDKKVRGSLARSTGKKARLTKSDLRLFSLLLDFRLMDTKHIMTWFVCDNNAKRRYMQTRLKLLFDKPNAYLDRVSRGNYFVDGGGSEPVIYALNSKGRRALIDSDSNKYADVSKRTANLNIKQNFINHTLFNTEIATHMKQGCDQTEDWLYVHRGVFFTDMITSELENEPRRNPNNYYGWPMTYHLQRKTDRGESVVTEEKTSLVPDYLSYIVNNKTESKLLLFIEADNNTEPVERVEGKLHRSDIWGKFMLYDRSANQQLFKKFFALEDPFRILFVTGSIQRMRTMIESNKSLGIRQGNGWNKFLFTTRDALNKHGFLDAPWVSGEDEQVIRFREMDI